MKRLALLALSALVLFFPLAGSVEGFVTSDCCCKVAADGCHTGNSAPKGVCSHGTCTCPAAPTLILPPSLQLGVPAAAPICYLAFRSTLTDGPDLAPEPPPPRS